MPGSRLRGIGKRLWFAIIAGFLFGPVVVIAPVFTPCGNWAAGNWLACCVGLIAVLLVAVSIEWLTANTRKRRVPRPHAFGVWLTWYFSGISAMIAWSAMFGTSPTALM
jgi:hypothetical protein